MKQPSPSLIAYLRSVSYFTDADQAVVEMIAAQMFRRTFRTGETLFLEGDRDVGLCLVESGRVKIFKLNPDGAEHILRIVGEGGTFNDIACLDDGPCPANAGALSDVVIHMLPTPVFQQALEDHPQLALRVVRLLAGRVRGLVSQIENLSLYSVIVRLTRFLLQQAEDPSLSGPGVTRTAIAAHINTTPQTISTALRSLEDMGAIEFDRHQIKIVNEKLMRSIANL